jgi:hypothetical protein
MTDKAKKILNKLNKRDRQARRYRKLSGEPGRREKILSEFNRQNLNEVGPLGGDQSMSVLKDMNEFQLDHDEFVKSLSPNVDVL